MGTKEGRKEGRGLATNEGKNGGEGLTGRNM